MLIKRFFLSVVLLLAAAAASCTDFADETLRYVVSYKWGIIHKEAGDATLSLRRKGNDYSIMLTAKTRSWADKIYRVRDTLISHVAVAGFKPRHYTRIAHEDGKYSRDDIAYSYSGTHVTGSCRRERHRNGKVSVTEKTLTADAQPWDMLSVFYFLRTIDYSRLTARKVVATTLFSGKEAESVTIRSLGEETIKLYNKKKAKALKVSFRFTTAGKKKSSEDITAWLSADSKRIPLLVTGSLPVGQIRCWLVD